MHKSKETDKSHFLIYTLTPFASPTLCYFSHQMGRHNSDMHSSIALLQERFRQLQRVKEIREERELLRVFSETERVGPTTRLDEPSRLFFHPQLILPTTPPMQGSFPFQPESQSKYARYQSVDTPLLMSLWPTDRSMPRRPNTLDDAEVDTSLHL